MTFRILQSQMDALALDTQRGFIDMLGGYLREYYPQWVSSIGASQLPDWLAQALKLCERHQVETEPEAAQLILLLTVLGLDAPERHDWVREVLHDRDLAALGKVKKLITLSRERAVDIEDVLVYPDMED